MITDSIATKSFQSERAFSIVEKIGLIIISCSCLFPYQFMDVITALEVSVTVYVLLSPNLNRILRENYAIFTLLCIPLLIGQVLGIGGFAVKITILVYVKICTYLCFMAIIGERCRNINNLIFFQKYIVLPIGIIICLSVCLDLYTSTLFFAKWQTAVFAESKIKFLENVHFSGLLETIELRNRGSGFAERPWHVAAWAMCGLMGLLCLRNLHKIKRIYFFIFACILFFVPFLVPQRNVIVTLFTGTFMYYYYLRKEKRNTKWILAVVTLCLLIIVFAVNQQKLSSLSEYGGRQDITALQKIGRTDFDSEIRRFDPRINMFLAEVDWFIENPIFIFFGAGYNVTEAPTIKPHSLYMSLLAACGIFGTALIIIFIKRQIKKKTAKRKLWRNLSPITKAGLLSLFSTGLFDSYFSGALGVPAFFLTLWITMCLISTKDSESEYAET